ncbi:zona pellucida glycoprotein d [Sphaeramia orbicularis]|uniref:Uromodulin-like n=1 Tax=Sphaeramia orbicularis TaxID=375764 RepID=A0A672YD47_9TELE|nr:uromodulin-like [Sphaeramia orbicularis]
MIPLGLKLSLALVFLLGFTLHSVLGRCSVKHCTDPTTCVLSTDRRNCRCIRGYYGDKCDKNAHIKVMCGKDYISIQALEDYFKYYKVPLESLHLPNKSCHLQKVKIHGVSYYMSRVSREQYLECGGKPPKVNSTHILYSLSLLSDPRMHENIIRDQVMEIDYTCVYPFMGNVSLGFPILPFSSETVIHVDDVDAKIQMTLYTDQTYTEVYTSAPTIELGAKVYVEVAETEPVDSFRLLVSECWATQTPQTTANTTEDSAYALLLDGCASDKTVSFINGSRNGEGPTIRYSFDMFRFKTEPKIYLHCTVQLCELEDTISCTPNCNSISKREAVGTDYTQALVSYGPILLGEPERPQSDIWTVVVPAACVLIIIISLIVIVAVAKAGKKRIVEIET